MALPVTEELTEMKALPAYLHVKKKKNSCLPAREEEEELCTACLPVCVLPVTEELTEMKKPVTEELTEMKALPAYLKKSCELTEMKALPAYLKKSCALPSYLHVKKKKNSALPAYLHVKKKKNSAVKVMAGMVNGTEFSMAHRSGLYGRTGHQDHDEISGNPCNAKDVIVLEYEKPAAPTAHASEGMDDIPEGHYYNDHTPREKTKLVLECTPVRAPDSHPIVKGEDGEQIDCQPSSPQVNVNET